MTPVHEDIYSLSFRNKVKLKHDSIPCTPKNASQAEKHKVSLIKIKQITYIYIYRYIDMYIYDKVL